MTGTARLADDTRRRFLAEIAARVPLDRLVEVHLFTPIRQGGIETGVAIVTARRAEPEIEPAPSTEVDAPIVDASMLPESSPDAIDALPPDEPADAAIEGADGAHAEALVAVPNDAALELAPLVLEADDAPPVDAAACDPTDDAAGPVTGAMGDADVAEEADPTDDVDDAVEEARPAPVRHTVFTARYRYTIKGPDRGKWDADVVEEADAPLVTVDAVVRGVQRRAGDAAEPDRLDAETVTRLLGGPPFAR
jgi:hypothetical protein